MIYFEPTDPNWQVGLFQSFLRWPLGLPGQSLESFREKSMGSGKMRCNHSAAESRFQVQDGGIGQRIDVVNFDDVLFDRADFAPT